MEDRGLSGFMSEWYGQTRIMEHLRNSQSLHFLCCISSMLRPLKTSAISRSAAANPLATTPILIPSPVATPNPSIPPAPLPPNPPILSKPPPIPPAPATPPKPL
ncbi:proline-rich protein 36-like, partial [Penaeus japonicus]|uniref:proline-rich protein 36-like n=1 Tax=Penaeus japonicus TaxID=27405 RepID=UPI001C714F08